MDEDTETFFDGEADIELDQTEAERKDLVAVSVSQEVPDRFLQKPC